MDAFLFISMMPTHTVAIGKKSLSKIPIFGQYFWALGHVFIDRADRRSAMGTMSKVKDLTLKKGLSVWMAPEGTRSQGRGLLPFKKGAFHLAVNAQRPIRPVVLSSFQKHVDLNRWYAGTVIIEAMEIISVEGKTISDLDELKNLARELIKQQIGILDERLTSL